MTVPATRKFDPARLFNPESISLSGTRTTYGQQILANLRAGGFKGAIGTDTDELDNADLAVLADAPEKIGAALRRHAKMGARGSIVLSHGVQDLGGQARAAGLRALGPNSFGLMLPGTGLNATPFSLMPPRGRVALVGQSSSIARTVIDWAVPNAVGFSHLLGIGGNVDMGFGLVLDHFSRDPNTAAIMIEIDRLRDPRSFFSAARAAARLRPVVAIAPGVHARGGGAAIPGTLEAALARAGVLLTNSISEYLAAAETLTRVKAARTESLAIITNSIAIGRLAADEALRSGITLAPLSPETRRVLSLIIPEPEPAAPIFAGKDSTQLADTAALLASAPEVGGILVIHAPTDGEGDTAIEALIACAKTVKIPLLLAAMGEATGLHHRHKLSQARLACFDSPESAIAGFRHLLHNRRNRAAARELPDAAVLEISPDKTAVAAAVATARAADQEQLVQNEALSIAAAYNINTLPTKHVTTPDDAAAAATELGFPAVLKLSHPDVPTHLLTGSVVLDLPDATALHDAARAILLSVEQRGADTAKAGFIVQSRAPRGTMLRIRVSDHPVLGPCIAIGPGGGDPEALSSLTADLPPLNLALAHALIRRSAISPALAAYRGQPAADADAIAAMLVQVSQLILDTPEIELLDLDPIFAGVHSAVAASARIKLRSQGTHRPPPIITPYPGALITTYEAKGQKFTLRPIRPEDADAHATMMSHISPEDMRYRFFSPLKQLPTEQITRMCDVDYTREMAFIAKHSETGATYGVSRLVRNDTDGKSAEFAVLVAPEGKGLGLGTALMRAIIAWGGNKGVAEITGQILTDNTPMLAFIKRLGFTLHHVPDEPDITEAKLPLTLVPTR
jgi:acetyltransferase